MDRLGTRREHRNALDGFFTAMTKSSYVVGTSHRLRNVLQCQRKKRRSSTSVPQERRTKAAEDAGRHRSSVLAELGCVGRSTLSKLLMTLFTVDSRYVKGLIEGEIYCQRETEC